jgi:ComF family protein
MNLKELLLDVLFPPHCLACRSPLARATPTPVLCNSCLESISVSETLFCIQCRARLADGNRICHATSPLRLASIGRYHDSRLKQLITALKYRRQTASLGALTALADRYLKNLDHDFTGYAVIPIPLHRTRERRRGFNQSLLIAHIVADRLGLPLIENGLQKTKATTPQASTKGRRERTKNLKDCFTVAQPEIIRDRKILLVDDVCTSGTTLIEAAKTLKQFGSKQILGFVIAKTD